MFFGEAEHCGSCCNPATWKAEAGDHHEFEASLGYTVNSRLTFPAVQDNIFKKKQWWGGTVQTSTHHMSEATREGHSEPQHLGAQASPSQEMISTPPALAILGGCHLYSYPTSATCWSEHVAACAKHA